MDDGTDRMNNLCADLVAERRWEPALVNLFRGKLAGEWISVGELYRSAGGTAEGIKPELLAAWLPPSPGGDPDYAVILFFDEESLWSLTAYYNKARLLGHADRTVAAH